MYTFYKVVMSNYVNVNILTVNNKSILDNKTGHQLKNIPICQRKFAFRFQLRLYYRRQHWTSSSRKLTMRAASSTLVLGRGQWTTHWILRTFHKVFVSNFVNVNLKAVNYKSTLYNTISFAYTMKRWSVLIHILSLKLCWRDDLRNLQVRLFHRSQRVMSLLPVICLNGLSIHFHP